MEKVDSFIRDLKERRKLESEKHTKAEIERNAEEAEMVKDLVEATENFIQTKEILAKNLNFLTSNKHSIRKVIQESDTAKGLPISIEYQQQAMNLFTDGITFMNNFKDVQRILEVDKNIDVSKTASDLVNCTKMVENELRKVRSSFNQVEALHSKVDDLKSTLFVDEVKYPHCAINGILLAKAKNKLDEQSSELQIVDAVPLFHICLHVSPMAEVALTMLDQYASHKGLVIAGYYLANENINDLSTDKPAHRTISDKIAENFGQALLVVVNNRELTYNMEINPLRISQYADGKWKPKEKANINFYGGKKLQNMMSCLMKEEDYRNLVDFDNHLDNIALDWQNLDLNNRIDKLMEKSQ